MALTSGGETPVKRAWSSQGLAADRAVKRGDPARREAGMARPAAAGGEKPCSDRVARWGLAAVRAVRAVKRGRQPWPLLAAARRL